MPDLFEIMETSRAMRRLKPDPVPDELIARILRAGACAPNGGNFQRWRFLVIKDRKIKEAVQVWYKRAFDRYDASLGEPGEFRDDAARRSWERTRDASRHLADHMGEAPALILVCAQQRRPPQGAAALTMVAPASVFPAVQNLLLAARVYGLAGVLTVNHEPKMSEIREILNMPEDIVIYAMVPLGFAAQRHGPKTRRPVEEVTFLNAWGAPLPQES